MCGKKMCRLKEIKNLKEFFNLPIKIIWFQSSVGYSTVSLSVFVYYVILKQVASFESVSELIWPVNHDDHLGIVQSGEYMKDYIMNIEKRWERKSKQ